MIRHLDPFNLNPTQNPFVTTSIFGRCHRHPHAFPARISVENNNRNLSFDRAFRHFQLVSFRCVSQDEYPIPTRYPSTYVPLDVAPSPLVHLSVIFVLATMAHNHEEEIDYESLPAGSSMAINMFAGAMVSLGFR